MFDKNATDSILRRNFTNLIFKWIFMEHWSDNGTYETLNAVVCPMPFSYIYETNKIIIKSNHWILNIQGDS